MQDYIKGIQIAYSGAGTTLLISGVAVVLGVVFGFIVALLPNTHTKLLIWNADV